MVQEISRGGGKCNWCCGPGAAGVQTACRLRRIWPLGEQPCVQPLILRRLHVAPKVLQNKAGANRVIPFPLFRIRLHAAAPLGVIALTGCLASIPGIGPTQIRLFDGALTVAAPNGYCVNPEPSTQTGGSAVVLIGRCRDGSQAQAAIVTVTVGEPGSGGVMAAGGEALSAFFVSNEGRATLARSGNPRDVTVMRAVLAGDDFLMLLNDTSASPYWRAITALNGRVITVSAAGTAAVPLTPEQSRDIVNASLLALHQANPAR